MNAFSLPEKIDTERLVLQRLRYEDAEEIFYTYASKPEVTKYLSWRTHQTTDDTRAFLRYAIASWYKGTDFSYTIRLKETQKMIGSFGVMNDHGKVQFGYVISPQHWNHGFATEVCRRMMEIISQQPQVYRLHTFVDTENEASIRVLQKSGLQYEATLVKWFRFVNQNNEPRDCVIMFFPLRR